MGANPTREVLHRPPPPLYEPTAATSQRKPSQQHQHTNPEASCAESDWDMMDSGRK